MIELAILAAIFGLLIGSFLNVCVSRLPEDLSVTSPRSYCPKCGTSIAWYDNIPLFSFLLLRGRCRHCRSRISLRYPLVELSTAAVFAGAVGLLGPTWAAAKLCVFSALCVGLIFADVEYRILPDEFTKGGTLLGLILSPVAPIEAPVSRFWLSGLPAPFISLADALAGAFLVPCGLWLVGWTYQLIRRREGLGFGDVKLMMMTGAFTGLQANLLILIAGSLLGSILGLGWIILRRQEAATYELPFGLFLGAAAVGVAFWMAAGLS